MNFLHKSEGIYLGNIKKIPIFLAYSWFIIAAFIVFTFTPTVQYLFPHYFLLQAGAVACGYAILLAISIFIHEISHACMALYFGWPPQKIVINLWGGHTQFHAQEITPFTSAAVALVGPIANLLLAGISYMVFPLSPTILIALLIQSLMYANLFVGIFNLLPGLPLDGGKVIEAIVWKITGSSHKGIVVAGWAGRILCVLLAAWIIGWPLLQGRQLEPTTLLFSVLLIGFLYAGASQAIKQSTFQKTLPQLDTSGFAHKAIAVPEHSSCAKTRQLVDAGFIVAVIKDSHLYAKVDSHALASVSEENLASTPTIAVSTPIDSSAVIASHLKGQALLQYISQLPGKEYFLIDTAGKIVGYVTEQKVIDTLLALEKGKIT